MRIKDVVALKEVVSDLNDGKVFYDQRYGLHRMLAKRFPYALYYEINDKIAYIVAILPMRRNPVWIKRKLEERS